MIIFVSVILSLNSYLLLQCPLLVFLLSPILISIYNNTNIIILIDLLVCLVIDSSTETKHKGFWEQNF